MELHFFPTPPGAARPAWITVRVKDPARLRRRAMFAALAGMGAWLVSMWLNVVWNGLVPMAVSLSVGAVGCVGLWLIATIDDAQRAEAKRTNEQQPGA
jgi:hypothetical protein